MFASLPYAPFFEALFAFKTLRRHQSHTQIWSARGLSVGIATAIITNYFQPCYPQTCLDCFNFIIHSYSTYSEEYLAQDRNCNACLLPPSPASQLDYQFFHILFCSFHLFISFFPHLLLASCFFFSLFYILLLI